MDKEKVIKGLECCVRYYDDENRNACVKCPYREPYPFTCMTLYPMLKDALEALKENETEDGEGTDGEPHPSAPTRALPPSPEGEGVRGARVERCPSGAFTEGESETEAQ